jgi:hypothetical protein
MYKIGAALVPREQGPDLTLQPPSPEVGATMFFSLKSGSHSKWPSTTPIPRPT